MLISVQTVAGVRAKPKWKESLTYEKQTLSGSKYRPRWFFDKNTEKPFIPEITEEQEKLATGNQSKMQYLKISS